MVLIGSKRVDWHRVEAKGAATRLSEARRSLAPALRLAPRIRLIRRLPERSSGTAVPWKQDERPQTPKRVWRSRSDQWLAKREETQRVSLIDLHCVSSSCRKRSAARTSGFENPAVVADSSPSPPASQQCGAYSGRCALDPFKLTLLCCNSPRLRHSSRLRSCQ